jgi:histidine phosphotransferase ChpT
MGQNIDFSALISSRICHDLISPIGAINNGLELLEMSAPSVGPEMALISDSVKSASARIRFFRIAFGAAGTQLVGRPEVTSILTDVYADTRITVAWGLLDGQPRNIVRLTFLALQCMETAMPYGGRIEITKTGDHMLLTGHADKFNVDPALWDMLVGAAHQKDILPAQVQFALLPLIASDNDRNLQIDTAGSQITIRI